jgi:hypothetical protein
LATIVASVKNRLFGFLRKEIRCLQMLNFAQLERCTNTGSVGMVVFMFQVLFHYATNPNTLFVVAETTFLDLRNKTEDKLKTMLEHLQKLFIVELPDGTGISCFIPGLKLFP